MSRLANLLLGVALVLGVVWAARRGAAGGVAVNADWVVANKAQLRRILSLPPGYDLRFLRGKPGSDAEYHQVTLEMTGPGRRQPLDIHVSRDGRRVLYGRTYELADPFREIRAQIRLDEAPARGPAGAPLTVVEYVDYTCGYCRQFYQSMEKPLLERYGGKVRLVYKSFPLVGLRAWSKEAAAAAACAYRQGNDKFWVMHEKLFEESARLKDGRAVLVTLARDAGLDTQPFTACLDQPQTRDAVARDVYEGERVGVEGTPTFFFNGRSVHGLFPPETFFLIVDEELAAAQRR